MSLTESERHQIIQLFQEKLGVEGGELMMKAIAPVGWGDIVTNHDLEMSQRVLAAELRSEMSELRGELRGEIIEVRADIRVMESGLRTELANGLRMQTFAILGGGSVLVGLGTVLSRLLA